jgi:hypothetical protein
MRDATLRPNAVRVIGSITSTTESRDRMVISSVSVNGLDRVVTWCAILYRSAPHRDAFHDHVRRVLAEDLDEYRVTLHLRTEHSVRPPLMGNSWAVMPVT